MEGKISFAKPNTYETTVLSVRRVHSMVIDLILFLAIVFGPMLLGVVLWALGNPAKRFRQISRFRLRTLMIAMIPLGIVFALFRLTPQMDAWARNIFLVMLSRVLPLLLLSGWLIYNCVEEFRHQAAAERKFPEDLPDDLFDEKSEKSPADQLDQAATSDFNASFREGARRRFGAVLERMNAFFNIQKRY